MGPIFWTISTPSSTAQIRKIKNADELSRVSIGEDPIFDKEEGSEDTDIGSVIEAPSLQINTTDPAVVKKKASKDTVLASVMSFIYEGCSLSLDPNDPARQFRKHPIP